MKNEKQNLHSYYCIPKQNDILSNAKDVNIETKTTCYLNIICEVVRISIYKILCIAM